MSALLILLLACAHRPRTDATLFAGRPGSTEPVTVLDNPGFTVGYSEARRNPLWVSYQLGPLDSPSSHPRPGFRVDARTSSRVSTQCYTHSGYDRGHIAPNDAISDRYGVDAQRATFLMSNVSPQTCGLNRGSWYALEKLVSEELARHRVFVISGPIFDADPPRIDCSVQVPGAFYKVVVRAGRRPSVLAVVMAQHDTEQERRLAELATTVDRVEELTGLDLFPELSDRVEARLESAEPDGRWDLDVMLKSQAGCADELAQGHASDDTAPAALHEKGR